MTTSESTELATAFAFAETNLPSLVSPVDGATGAYVVDRRDEDQGRVVELLDVVHLLPTPRRSEGTTKLHTPDSLVEWVHRVTADAVDLYADIDTLSVVAVLNPSRASKPAWQDHCGRLVLRRHPSWERWCAIDGKLLDQAAFAAHVQECAGDIAEPPALDLLEVAETLTLNVGQRVSSAVRLRDGQRHIIFDENVEAKAGHDLEVDVPERLILRVPLFEGCEAEEVTVRLLYRQRDGVKFAVQIVDRADRERETFSEAVAKIGEAVDSLPVYGVPS